jgi:hypothetical protein
VDTKHKSSTEVSKMDINTFVVTVYCVIDDWLKGKRVRQRGPQPRLSDSEVLTLEVVGAFLGLDNESSLYRYFCRHWSSWFPALRQVHRTTVTRQMANLCWVKEQLWQALLPQLLYDPQLSFVDSFPLPACRFARAHRCRRLRGLASFGRDDLTRGTFYGLRAHLRVCYPGVIVAFALAPAHVHDLHFVEPLSEKASGILLADRNYWSPQLRERLAQQGLILSAPYKSAKREPSPYPFLLTRLRRRIETVIGQLTERFQAKCLRARDVWHLSSRWLRMVLSHTLAIYCCQQAGLTSPLAFARLLSD